MSDEMKEYENDNPEAISSDGGIDDIMIQTILSEEDSTLPINEGDQNILLRKTSNDAQPEDLVDKKMEKIEPLVISKEECDEKINKSNKSIDKKINEVINNSLSFLLDEGNFVELEVSTDAPSIIRLQEFIDKITDILIKKDEEVYIANKEAKDIENKNRDCILEIENLKEKIRILEKEGVSIPNQEEEVNSVAEEEIEKEYLYDPDGEEATIDEKETENYIVDNIKNKVPLGVLIFAGIFFAVMGFGYYIYSAGVAKYGNMELESETSGLIMNYKDKKEVYVSTNQVGEKVVKREKPPVYNEDKKLQEKIPPKPRSTQAYQNKSVLSMETNSGLDPIEEELYGIDKKDNFHFICRIKSKYPSGEYAYYVKNEMGEYSLNPKKEGIAIEEKNVVINYSPDSKFTKIEKGKYLKSKIFTQCRPLHK